jgi:hypothetical protein
MRSYLLHVLVAAVVSAAVSIGVMTHSFAPATVQASQNQLSSPTTGTVSGLQLTNSFNNALDSLNTANSGATAPTNQLSGAASLGNWWLNTASAPYPLGMYDGASNWPILASLDPSAHAWNVQIGGGVATLASASTADLCASLPQNRITITGMINITSFGATCPAGVIKIITFSGILLLTNNNTSLIIPGGANVMTAAGDQAVLQALGAGNWQVVAYTPASGTALINPAVDLGTYLFTSLTAPPSSKYLFAFGQPVSRTIYAALMAGETITQTVTSTNGSPTLTGFSDTTQIKFGACVEGPGIPNSGACTTTIVSCTATTCTMNNNAAASGTANVTIFPNGNGDGATTFNLPNCQGVTLAGRDNMSGTPRGLLTSTYFNGGNYAGADALGSLGGMQNQTLAQANLGASWTFPVSGITLNDPGHNHTPQFGAGSSFFGSNGPGAVETISGPNGAGFLVFSLGGVTSSSFTGISITSQGRAASGGASTPVGTVQPTLTANCMLRVLAKLDLPLMPANKLAANDDMPVADRPRAAA